MQPRKDFGKGVDPEKQEEIFFTMKVYATTTKGKLKTLKYSIDFHPPFEANTSTIAPFASPLVGNNMMAFRKIFHNVKEVFRFIADPTGYKYESMSGKKYDAKAVKPAAFRLDEQKRLAKAIELSKGAINHVTYELNSPPEVTVGALFNATGNGDMKPPPAGVE